ncbi:MAG: hypothetical protein A3I39_00585 [Candidatus Yanofskybacteria bacterium RIFCSPLOWO2_02_FULL_47_9b]|uniref:Uncharacterized protein n=1 Tax=Candidatus Yanofskybacteria bacterium RIFCSPLOWO2_02_FULL_47_9b TaxID=1802708 RepID=A0A1F8HBJ1_9BACT|nr:MAG: hypothetical protein A3I39_00585 [Candidatus Yanofskybacteria bacterium RIFCSPLOWO2_02_FULL_47_9b]
METQEKLFETAPLEPEVPKHNPDPETLRTSPALPTRIPKPEPVPPAEFSEEFGDVFENGHLKEEPIRQIALNQQAERDHDLRGTRNYHEYCEGLHNGKKVAAMAMHMGRCTKCQATRDSVLVIH